MITIPGLLLHCPFPTSDPTFNHAGFDSTYGKNLWNNYGVTIDTSVYKYGGGSGKFIAANSTQLIGNNRSELNFGTGDFTIGFWMNCLTAITSMGLPGFIGQKDSNSSNGFQIYRNSSINSTKMAMRVNGQTDVFSNSNIDGVGVWQHWAFVRASGTLYIFKNGILDKTVPSFTYNITTAASEKLSIGSSMTWTGYFNGYLDDIFISNQAIWTSSFTPDEINWSGTINTAVAKGSSRFKKMARWPGDQIGVKQLKEFRRMFNYYAMPAYGFSKRKPNAVRVRFESFNYGDSTSKYPLLMANTNGNLRGVVLQNTVPVAFCRVALYDRKAFSLVDASWTKTDGSFRFNNLPVGYDGFFIIAFDPDGNPMQNSVILDRLVAT